MRQFQNCKLIRKLLWSHSVNVIILQKRLCTICCLWLLISCSFNVVPTKLNSSQMVKVKRADADIATHDSILDTYSKGQKYVKEVPDFMELDFINFAKNYKVANEKLINQAENTWYLEYFQLSHQMWNDKTFRFTVNTSCWSINHGTQIRTMLGVIRKILNKYLYENGKSFWKAQLQSNMY